MQKNISSKTFSIFILVIGIILLSIAPLIIKWAEAPGVVTSFYRMFIAASLITFIKITKKRPKAICRVPLAVLIAPVIAGLFSGIDHSLWSSAIHNTFVAKANLLNYIAPIWVGLVSVFLLHKNYSNLFWVGLIIVLLGAWAISGVTINDFSTVSFRGEGFAFFSSFFYAGYILISEQSRKKIGSASYVQISSFSASIVLLIIMIINGYSLTGYSNQTFLLFGAAGLFSQLGGYLCLVYSLGKLSAPIVSSFLILQPVLTAILATVFFNETIEVIQLLGGIFVLGGIFLIDRSKETATKTV